MRRGQDVLIVYDDLTRHARAYRELSLLLRHPPGREAYPGDIFYIHARLLERSTHLRSEHSSGSLTALPIIETQARNMSAYIPTNLISITDGQIYLSPPLFEKGQLPAIDIGRSVSRVGGKAQLPAYRAVAADLRLAYAQFEELETFARFGTRLDDDTRSQLERGPATFSIFGESSSNAAGFTTEHGNISSRERTNASVTWSPLEWRRIGKAGSVQRTENLASVIQEIVDGAQWASVQFTGTSAFR